MGRRKHPKGVFPGRLVNQPPKPKDDHLGIVPADPATKDLATLSVMVNGERLSLRIKNPDIQLSRDPAYVDATVFGDTQKTYLVNTRTSVVIRGELAGDITLI